MAASLHTLSAFVLVHRQAEIVEKPSQGLAQIVSWLSAKLDWSGRAARDSEVGAFLQANGGVLTDELERAISRRFGRIVG